jgi:hypothetical protein
MRMSEFSGSSVCDFLVGCASADKGDEKRGERKINRAR